MLYQKPKNVGFCPIWAKYARNGSRSTQTVSVEWTIKEKCINLLTNGLNSGSYNVLNLTICKRKTKIMFLEIPINDAHT